MHWFRGLVAVGCAGCALSAWAFWGAVAQVAARTVVEAYDEPKSLESMDIPSIPLFGNRQCVYGIDLGTFGGKTECVHGLAVRIVAGGVERQMNGIEVGVTGTGSQDGMYFRQSCINGMKLGGLFSECGTANGILAGGLGSRAQRVNGLQLGLLNEADDVRGLQVGLYNAAKTVKGAQIGLVNWRENAPCPYLPLLRVVLD